MSEHDNLKVVKGAYLALRNRDFDALRNFLQEDASWFATGSPDLIASAGASYGDDQVEQYFASLDEMEDIQSFEPAEFILEGNKVVAIGELTRRLDANGSSVKSPWVHVFTLRSGKICDFRSFHDTSAAVTTLAPMVQARDLRRSEAWEPGIL